MSIPTTLESLSQTAASNGPSGSDQRTLADDGIRQAYAFLAQAIQSGSNIASATTITPPSLGSSFHITGTTAITTIASTNSWNGRLICLIFDGILTFTHSSNLALPGSANITTAANDVAFMRQDSSGSWRCVNYTRASGALLASSGVDLTLTGNLSVQGNTTLGNGGTDTTTTNGNVTLTAPTAGATIAIGGVGGGSSVVTVNVPSTASATPIALQQAGTNLGFIGLEDSGANFVVGGATSDLAFRSENKNIILSANAGSSVQVKLAAAGNVTVNAPSSGDSVTINNGTVGSFAVRSSLEANSVIHAWWNGNTSANQATLRFNGAVTRFGSDRASGSLELTYASSTTGLAIASDGRVYGTALHNNAGAVTGTTNQYIASGTYTVTATAGTNVSSATGGSARWVRVGNIVYVSGTVTIDPTSASTNSDLGLSLPIASNLTGSDLSGLAVLGQGTTLGQVSGVIGDDSANDRAQLSWISGSDIASRNWQFYFQYTVL